MSLEENFSQRWKDKFQLLESIGANSKSMQKTISCTEFKQLSFAKKIKIQFNLLAFLFGPFYYYIKGLTLKADLFLALNFLLSSIVLGWAVIFDIVLPLKTELYISLGVAGLCSNYANFDYYRLIKNNEKMWSGLPEIFNSQVATKSILILSILSFTLFTYMSPSNDVDFHQEVGGVWKADVDAAIVKIDLEGKQKVISINEHVFLVAIESTDNSDRIITLGVNNNSQKELWALRQVHDNLRNFTLMITLADGTQDTLSYVRELTRKERVDLKQKALMPDLALVGKSNTYEEVAAPITQRNSDYQEEHLSAVTSEKESITSQYSPSSEDESSVSINTEEEYVRFISSEIMKRKSYPSIARRNGWEGTVKIRLHIDEDGNLSKQVKESSGYESLDKSALDTVPDQHSFTKISNFTIPKSIDLIIPVTYKLD